ncbi:MAG: zinc-ribbon domain-containing protein [Euryarchaeota archaeon]|nr:zinc-ribbon domain-containing protein [Euryarchaeota archaeon]
MSTTCQQCQATLMSDWKTCPHCGTTR